MADLDINDWSKLNSSLYAAAFLAQSGKGKSCSLCTESDHLEEDCALAPPKSSTSSSYGGRQTGVEAGSRFARGKSNMGVLLVEPR